MQSRSDRLASQTFLLCSSLSDLCNSCLNIPGVSGGHGLQSNAMLTANLDLPNLQWVNHNYSLRHDGVLDRDVSLLTCMVLVGRRFVVDTDSQYLIASETGVATD